MLVRILVTLDDKPGRCVRCAGVEHFALLDDDVQGAHELSGGRIKVPPVHIKDVNVVSPHSREGFSQRNMERLYVVSTEVGEDGIFFDVVQVLVCGEFGG